MLNIFRRKPSVAPAAEQVAEKAAVQAEGGRILYRGVAPQDRWDQIEFAFNSGGINYFKFVAEVNVPFQRAVAARDIFTEELWQINPDFLRGWNNGLINLLMDKKKKDDDDKKDKEQMASLVATATLSAVKSLFPTMKVENLGSAAATLPTPVVTENAYVAKFKAAKELGLSDAGAIKHIAEHFPAIYNAQLASGGSTSVKL